MDVKDVIKSLVNGVVKQCSDAKDDCDVTSCSSEGEMSEREFQNGSNEMDVDPSMGSEILSETTTRVEGDEATMETEISGGEVKNVGNRSCGRRDS